MTQKQQIKDNLTNYICNQKKDYREIFNLILKNYDQDTTGAIETDLNLILNNLFRVINPEITVQVDFRNQSIQICFSSLFVFDSMTRCFNAFDMIIASQNEFNSLEDLILEIYLELVLININ